MNYVNKIGAIFQNRCPNVTIISPEDYRTIAEWEKQQIPLDIIADAINSVCDSLDGSAAEIDSIRYFHNTIKNNFITWLQTENGTSRHMEH